VSTIGIREIATVVRSKNAGPFRFSFDIVFTSAEVFRAVRDGGYITRRMVGELYSVAENEMRLIWFEPAHALKITMARPHSAASFHDRDAYGAQQHVPLLGLTVPAAVRPDTTAGEPA